jgi:hypothetical protein
VPGLGASKVGSTSDMLVVGGRATSLDAAVKLKLEVLAFPAAGFFWRLTLGLLKVENNRLLISIRVLLQQGQVLLDQFHPDRARAIIVKINPTNAYTSVS